MSKLPGGTSHRAIVVSYYALYFNLGGLVCSVGCSTPAYIEMCSASTNGERASPAIA